jgi:hypothetical protein
MSHEATATGAAPVAAELADAPPSPVSTGHDAGLRFVPEDISTHTDTNDPSQYGQLCADWRHLGEHMAFLYIKSYHLIASCHRQNVGFMYLAYRQTSSNTMDLQRIGRDVLAGGAFVWAGGMITNAMEVS